MLYSFASLVSGFATFDPDGDMIRRGYVQIEGVQCAASIEPGVSPPSRSFVIGLAEGGATSPADGFGCSKSGCEKFMKGEKSDDDTAFIMHFDRGDVLPSASFGILGCALAPNKNCMQVSPGFMASDEGILTSFTRGDNPAMTSPWNGLWVDYGTESHWDIKPGDPIRENSYGMFVMGLGPGDSVTTDVLAAEAIFCPIDTREMGMNRRKMSLK